MRSLVIVLMLCACGSKPPVGQPDAETPPVRQAEAEIAKAATPPVVPNAPIVPRTAASCGPLQAAPSWSGWRGGGKLDPCVRLTNCAKAGCAAATCLHRHYGCLDSGSISVDQEQRLGAAFFVTVSCCPQ